MWCACQNTLRRPRVLTFLKFLTHQEAFSFSQGWERTVTHEYPSCVALRMIADCFSLSSLLQALLASSGHPEVCSWTDGKGRFAGFLLRCSRMSCSPYHWVIIQISLWQPWKTGADSTIALLTAFCILGIIHTHLHLHRKFHLNMRKNNFTVQVTETAQRDCGVSPTGDTYEAFGHNSVPFALG